MDHQIAKDVFLEIQKRPYSISLFPNETCDNCYYKGIELIQRLAVLGYTVRGRIGETYWDPNIIPKEILSLMPSDLLNTHFLVEIFIDDKWMILDTSFQKSLSKYGFTIGSWGRDSQSCFPITKLYSQEESIAYQQSFFDPKTLEELFNKARPFYKELNKWFKAIADN